MKRGQSIRTHLMFKQQAAETVLTTHIEHEHRVAVARLQSRLDKRKKPSDLATNFEF